MSGNRAGWWSKSAFTGVACLLLVCVNLNAQAPALPAVPWVRIPAGNFQMGCVPNDTRCEADEQPRHPVTISRPFDMMATEVTVGMYRATAPPAPPEQQQPAWTPTPAHPVTIVNWNEARTFCEAIGGRLPTEAEWEYAARGGRDGAVFPWGDQSPTDRAGAVNGVAFESDSPKPVRSFAPNGYGLYDMAGNVWEWVADWYGRYEAGPATDPRGPASGQARAVRGGSYGDDDGNLRLSNRSANLARNRNLNIGFRCARDVSP
jgi:formylglycine-generating enzyme required for sulfatase activity